MLTVTAFCGSFVHNAVDPGILKLQPIASSALWRTCLPSRWGILGFLAESLAEGSHGLLTYPGAELRRYARKTDELTQVQHPGLGASWRPEPPGAGEEIKMSY